MITRDITYSGDDVDVKVIGQIPDAPGLEMPESRCTRDATGLHVTLVWTGKYTQLATYQAGNSCTPGYTSLPDGMSLVDEDIDIKLMSSELVGLPGGVGQLTNTYAERNEREIDDDMADGLLSRNVSIQWMERQEAIELLASRITDDELGVYNGVLVEMWRNEEDAEAKANFKVRLFEDDGEGGQEYVKTVALDNEDTDIDAKLNGSPLTKAIAERIAQGVEYASRYNLQVIVTETWRAAPTLEYLCNEILADSLPTTHQPIFSMPGAGGSATWDWMRMSDTCQQVDMMYQRTIVYLGIPTSMTPNPAPTNWGTTPFDEMLYHKESGSSSSGGSGQGGDSAT